jgi:hypothetical protein
VRFDTTLSEYGTPPRSAVIVRWRVVMGKRSYTLSLSSLGRSRNLNGPADAILLWWRRLE